MREYLDMLDDAAFGGATPVTPKRINLTDPASRWTAATREAAFYAYSTNYLIDLDHAVSKRPLRCAKRNLPPSAG